MVGQPIEQGGHAGGVGEDGVPRLKREVRGYEERPPLIAAVDDLKEEVGGPVVVGEESRLRKIGQAFK